MGWALTRKTANPLAKLVLVILANRSDVQGWSFMSQATIAKAAGVERKTINRMLAVLADEGHIQRVQRFTKTGARTSDHIRISCGFSCTSQVHPPVPESYTIPSSPYGVKKGKKEEGGLRLITGGRE